MLSLQSFASMTAPDCGSVGWHPRFVTVVTDRTHAQGRVRVVDLGRPMSVNPDIGPETLASLVGTA